MQQATSDGGPTGPEDRAAMRAFLQRAEVRLSSIHRAATALLSGAGVLVLLPTLSREALVTVARALLSLERTLTSTLLLVGVAGVLAAMVAVIWLLLFELTQFYYHSAELSVSGRTSFSPHLALSSLRIATDEVSPQAAIRLGSGRDDVDSIGLIVPPNVRGRDRIDRQVAAHRSDRSLSDDRDRADALLGLVGARDHDLATEVARTEYVMARHAQHLQVIILRYLKALLVVIVSLILVLTIAAVVEPPSPVGPRVATWTVVLLLVWAPTAMFATTSPVRWIGALLRSEGASRSGIRYDPEMTRLERVMAALTSGVVLAAIAAGVDIVRRGDEPAVLLLGALVAGAIGQAALLIMGRHIGRPSTLIDGRPVMPDA